jgi:hypothetical protein
MVQASKKSVIRCPVMLELTLIHQHIGIKMEETSHNSLLTN